MRRRPDPRQHHEAGGEPKDFEPGTLLPGIKVNTSPTDFYPIEQVQLKRFKGETWELFGPILSGEVAG